MTAAAAWGTADARTCVPRSLLWATDIDTLPRDRVVLQRDPVAGRHGGYLVVRSPTNPTHHWGNLLLFDDPPGDGDGAAWERLFGAELGADSRVQHIAFGWDHDDGRLGRALEEFVARGYQLEQTVGLVATPAEVRPHPRGNGAVVVRALDAAGVDDDDDGLWEQVVELQVAGRDESFAEEGYRTFTRARQAGVRELLTAGRGAWYVAIDPGSGQVLASCGVVATDGRGRFQSVDTAAAHRRRGICSRLVVEASQDSARRFAVRRLVIGADPGYHALGLYESLGFRRAESVCGVCWHPGLA